MKKATLTAILVALFATGCGGDDGGQANRDGPARTLQVSSQGDYKRTALPLAERVVSVGERLPKAGDYGNAKFSDQAKELANEIKRASDRLAPVTPPAELLSDHQFLTDAVTIVEFDLRDVADAGSRAAAKAALERTAADLARLETLTNTIKGKL